MDSALTYTSSFPLAYSYEGAGLSPIDLTHSPPSFISEPNQNIFGMYPFRGQINTGSTPYAQMDDWPHFAEYSGLASELGQASSSNAVPTPADLSVNPIAFGQQQTQTFQHLQPTFNASEPFLNQPGTLNQFIFGNYIPASHVNGQINQNGQPIIADSQFPAPIHSFQVAARLARGTARRRSRRTSSLKSDPRVSDQCIACFDQAGDIKMTQCRHQYCSECFNNMVKVGLANKASYPPHCCARRGIDLDKMKRHLDQENTLRWELVREEYKAKNPMFCANKRCSTFLSQKVIDKAIDKFVRCNDCATETCSKCRQLKETHKGINYEKCLDAEQLMNEEDQKLAKARHWKQCPGCKNLTEKTDGCDHMSCACGTLWCYRCSSKRSLGTGLCACFKGPVREAATRARAVQAEAVARAIAVRDFTTLATDQENSVPENELSQNDITGLARRNHNPVTQRRNTLQLLGPGLYEAAIGVGGTFETNSSVASNIPVPSQYVATPVGPATTGRDAINTHLPSASLVQPTLSAPHRHAHERQRNLATTAPFTSFVESTSAGNTAFSPFLPGMQQSSISTELPDPGFDWLSNSSDAEMVGTYLSTLPQASRNLLVMNGSSQSMYQDQARSSTTHQHIMQQLEQRRTRQRLADLEAVNRRMSNAPSSQAQTYPTGSFMPPQSPYHQFLSSGIDGPFFHNNMGGGNQNAANTSMRFGPYAPADPNNTHNNGYFNDKLY